MIRYCKIEGADLHLRRLIEWLRDDVISAGGDGDAIWYSCYYDINDIRQFILKFDLFGKHWIVDEVKDESFSIHYGQESIFITNRQEDFDNRPSWQQVSISY